MKKKISDYFPKDIKSIRDLKSKLFYYNSFDFANDKKKKWLRHAIPLGQFFFSLFEAFFKLDLLSRAAALTLFSLLSAVPFFALVSLALNKAQIDVDASSLLHNFYFAQPDIQFNTLQESSQKLIDYLTNDKRPFYLGVIGCALALFYTTYNFYGDIDKNFNIMWQVKSRSIGRKILHSFALVILGALMVYSAGQETISNRINEIYNCGEFFHFFVPFLSIWVLFCIAFWWIPNTKVRFRSAAISSGLSALIIVLFETLMSKGLIERNNDVYGHLANLFIIIAFLQFSWIIVLCGVNMTARIEKQDASYLEVQSESLSPAYRRFISVIIASYIYNNYRRCGEVEQGVTIEDIRMKMFKGSDNINRFLPNILIASIMKELKEKHIIASIDKRNPKRLSKWIPYRPEDFEKYTVGDMLFALDFHGTYDLKFRYEDALLQKCGWGELVTPIIETYAKQKELLKDIIINPDINIVADKDKEQQKESCKYIFKYYQDQISSINEWENRDNISPNSGSNKQKFIRTIMTKGKRHVIKFLKKAWYSRK